MTDLVLSDKHWLAQHLCCPPDCHFYGFLRFFWHILTRKTVSL